MDSSEYLAFIPLLFYGIALADLLGQWRLFFDSKYFYLPYFVTTLLFTEVAVYNVYSYLEVIQDMVGAGYLKYWSFLIQPILFLLAVNALTPESDNKDTEGYFTQRISIVYGLMAAFIFTHFLSGIGTGLPVTFARVAAIVLCLAIAVTRKKWLIYVTIAIWFLSLLGRIQE